MTTRIHVPPLGWQEQLGDAIMAPVMRLVSGTIHESPQRTHRWNCRHLTLPEIRNLTRHLMVQEEKDPSAVERKGLRFHLPVFGGWRRYIVLSPQQTGDWHIGWISHGDLAMGISRIRLSGPVRMLRGRHKVEFFGINAETGCQIPIHKIGEGEIGSGGLYAQLPLL